MSGRKHLGVVSAVEVAAGGLAEVEELEVDWQDLVAVQDIAELDLMVSNCQILGHTVVRWIVVTYWNQAIGLVAARVDINVVAALWSWVAS